ncbi:MAG: hypothetical protein RLZZ89_215 [Cyanobacteriota bacterium]|jgi:hypothetical protein
MALVADSLSWKQYLVPREIGVGRTCATCLVHKFHAMVRARSEFFEVPFIDLIC